MRICVDAVSRKDDWGHKAKSADKQWGYSGYADGPSKYGISALMAAKAPIVTLGFGYVSMDKKRGVNRLGKYYWGQRQG